MGTVIFATASSSIIELSMRAIMGASLALFVLFVLTALFKQNEEIKKLLYVLIVAMVIFTSTILVATAIVRVQDYALIPWVLAA